MAESPAPRSPLAPLGDRLPARVDGAALAEEPPRAQFDLRLDISAAGAMETLGTGLGMAPPQGLEAAARGERRAFRLGPDEWLATAPLAERDALESALQKALSGRVSALTDVSAARVWLTLSGARALEILMKGCRLDLHPRAFGPGAVAQTNLAKAQILLHRPGEAPLFEIAVRSSVALYLAAWLLDAMEEYGPASSAV